MRRVPAAAAALLLGGCAPDRPASHLVEIRGFRFAPDTLEVSAGDTVVWINRDIVPHTASGAGGLESGPVPGGASGRWTAPEAGTHDYRCAYHPTMRGTVVVR